MHLCIILLGQVNGGPNMHYGNMSIELMSLGGANIDCRSQCGARIDCRSHCDKLKFYMSLKAMSRQEADQGGLCQ